MRPTAERTIEIVHEPFGAGFDVRVCPPVVGEPLDAEFQSYQQAFGWAQGLRTTRGWRIFDRTGLSSV